MVFVENIEELTLNNNDYRRVIFTSDYSQLVLMSIPVGEDIDLEIHPYVDQFFRIEQGNGELRVGKDSQEIFKIKNQTGLVVPHNTYHRIVNTGNVPLKLYSIYSPPNHPPNKVEHKKEEAKETKDNKYKQIILHIFSY